MRIAIFGKQNARREQLQQQLRLYWHDRQAACEATVYDDAALFCADMRDRTADLAFLLLEDSPAEAFAAAQALREITLDCEIVFVADSPAHVADAMAFRAMGYLLWPPEAGALDEVLERFLRGQMARQYAVHTRLVDHLVSHEKIRYFHSDGHYVNVYVEGRAEPLVHLRRLDDIHREVAALPYVRCHQRYLVNRMAIERFDGHCLLLKDGTVLPVSRRYVRDVVTDVKMDVELHNKS